MTVRTAVGTDDGGTVSAPVIVVGAGTAGTSFVLEFARNSGLPLTVVEPGSEAVGSASHRFLDAVRPENLWSDVMVECVRNGPVQAYPQARALGGGSAVNGMLDDPVEIPEAALRAVGTAALRVAESSGPPVGQVSGALLALGGRRWAMNRDDAGRVDRVSALCAMADAGRVGLVRGEVERVVIEDGRATGVLVDGRFLAASKVVMAAGTVGTARILDRSDLPAGLAADVGHGLTDHPAIAFMLHLREPAGEQDPDSAAFLGVGSARWHRPERAEIMNAPVHPVLTMPPAPRGVISAFERASTSEPHLGMLMGILFNAGSVGHIDFGGSVVLRPNMVSVAEDQVAMLGLLREMIKVALCPEIAAISTHVTVDSAGTRVTEIAGLPDDLLLEWAKSHLVPVAHATGSCRLLVSRRMAPWRGVNGPTERPAADSRRRVPWQRDLDRMRDLDRQLRETARRLVELQTGWRPSAGRGAGPGFSAMPSAVVGVEGLHIVDGSVLANVDGMPNARIAAHAAQQAQFLAAITGRDETGRTA